MQYCHKQLDDLVIDDQAAGTARLQPCKSPVWDTAIALRALRAERRGGRQPAIRERRRAGCWSKQTTPPRRLGGDRRRRAGRLVLRVCQRVLSRLRRHGHGADGPADAVRRDVGAVAGTAAGAGAVVGSTAPGGTSDGLASEPRSARRADDTAAAIDRGLRWMLAMQNDDGGWGAFDRNNDREFLCYVPFADHNAMIDPSTPDLTGRVLEAWGSWAAALGDPAVDRAVAYVRRHAAGRRQLVRPLGRQLHLRHLAVADRPGRGRRAGRRSGRGGGRQLAAGPSAGRAAAGANRPTATSVPQLRGQGTPTASQTAWAVLGLLAAGLEEHPATIRGIRYLIAHAARRRHLGRARVHRHRLSARVLSAVSLLSDLLPAAGPGRAGRAIEAGMDGVSRRAVQSHGPHAVGVAIEISDRILFP